MRRPGSALPSVQAITRCDRAETGILLPRIWRRGLALPGRRYNSGTPRAIPLPMNATHSMTTPTVNDDQIRALRSEAATAGDHAAALICDIATGEVDADDGYDHLAIWSLLTPCDRRSVAQLDLQGAHDYCADVILSAQGMVGGAS